VSELYSNSIFWIETEKIKPNPYQPRREFDERKLKELAESVRQYGIFQPLVVSRMEIEKPDGGIVVEYELIAGERRLRAAKIAGLSQVPATIRVGDDSMVKLEIAIIENLQREDLNAIDRARAFERLVNEFNFTHIQVAKKVGKSREYVSNTLRLLSLPEEVMTALAEGKINEGHTRPILMLGSYPEQQTVLFKEIVYKKITVREAESFARRIAQDKVRKKEYASDPELIELEKKLEETLGTRVKIERKDFGGHIKIDFFSKEDLAMILDLMKANQNKKPTEMLEKFIEQGTDLPQGTPLGVAAIASSLPTEADPAILTPVELTKEEISFLDDRSEEEKKKDEDDLYSINNFSL